MLMAGCVPEPCPEGSARRDDGVCAWIAEDAEAPDSGGDQEGESLPWSEVEPPEEGEPSSAWSEEEVQAALDLALSQALPDPFSLQEAWLGYFGESDGVCPAADPYQIEVGVEGCTTSAGWTYAGPALYAESEEAESYALLLVADSFVVRPTGETVVVSVISDYQRAGADGARSWTLELAGTLADPLATDWLGQGASLDLDATGSDDGPMVLDGGVHVGTAPALGARSLAIDSSCPLDGVLAVRDDAGRWIEIELDCAECGVARMADAELGEVCPDATILQALATTLEGP